MTIRWFVGTSQGTYEYYSAEAQFDAYERLAHAGLLPQAYNLIVAWGRVEAHPVEIWLQPEEAQA